MAIKQEGSVLEHSRMDYTSSHLHCKWILKMLLMEVWGKLRFLENKTLTL